MQDEHDITSDAQDDADERTESETHPVFRDGRVHVLAEQCSTCIFRPGNLMELHRGRVKGMVDHCLEVGGQIPCHCTIHRDDDVEAAICRGFYDRYRDRIQLLEIAERMEVITFDPLPVPEK